MQEKLYKRVDNNLQSCNGGKHQWALGKTVHVKPPLIACKHGIHACTTAQLPRWLGSTILELEVSGERLDQEDKSVVESAIATAVVGRLTRRQIRLWAADCAERVLNLFTKVHLDDERPKLAIEAARKYATGNIAAANAAYAAAAAAAYAAAADAERQWQGERLLSYAVGNLPRAVEPYRAYIMSGD